MVILTQNHQDEDADIVTTQAEDVLVMMKLLCDLAKATFRGWSDKYKGKIDNMKKIMLKSKSCKTLSLL